MTTSWVKFPEVTQVRATTATTVAEAATSVTTQLCDVLRGGVNTAASSYDPVRGVAAVINGDEVNVINPCSGQRVTSIDVGEALTAVSMYDGAIWLATATKGVFYPDYLNPVAENTPGGAGIIAGQLWSTTSDSNPTWPSEVSFSYPTQFPENRLFLVEVLADRYFLYDMASVPRVLWTTRVFTEILRDCSYAEGSLELATNGGRYAIRYAEDETRLSTTAGTAKAAGIDGAPGIPTGGEAVLSDDLLVVDARVAPDTTQKQTAGNLFIPTFAVGSAIGASVGFDESALYDITSANITNASLSEDGRLALENANIVGTGERPTADVTFTAWSYFEYSNLTTPALLGGIVNHIASTDASEWYIGGDEGLTRLSEHLSDPAQGIVSYTTITYATSGMKKPGGAWFCDDDPNSIGQPPILAHDYSEPNEITASDDFSGALQWVADTAGDTVDIVNERLRLINNQGTTENSQARTGFPVLTADEYYDASMLVVDVESTGSLRIVSPSTTGTAVGSGGTSTLSWRATGNTTFRMRATSASDGYENLFDDFLVERVVALSGIAPRSTNTDFQIISEELYVSGEVLAYGYYTVPFDNGTSYIVKAVARAGTSANATLSVGTTPGGSELGTDTTTSGTNIELSVSFTAPAGPIYVSLQNGNDIGTAIFDSVQADEDPVEEVPDYSGQNNPLAATGTIQKQDSCAGGPDCCVQAGVITRDAYATGTVPTPGELAGYEEIDGVWLYRTRTEDWVAATEAGGALTVRAPKGETIPVKQLRWVQ